MRDHPDAKKLRGEVGDRFPEIVFPLGPGYYLNMALAFRSPFLVRVRLYNLFSLIFSHALIQVFIAMVRGKGSVATGGGKAKAAGTGSATNADLWGIVGMMKPEFWAVAFTIVRTFFLLSVSSSLTYYSSGPLHLIRRQVFWAEWQLRLRRRLLFLEEEATGGLGGLRHLGDCQLLEDLRVGRARSGYPFQSECNHHRTLRCSTPGGNTTRATRRRLQVAL